MQMRFSRGRGCVKAIRVLGCIALVLLGQAFVTGDASAGHLVPVEGVSSVQAEFMVGKSQRRALYIRPTVRKPGLAPAIVLLHYAGGDPESMANLTAISKLVRDTGIWAILPEARGRSWSTDPVRDANGPDDVGLLTQVIDFSISAFPIDPKRVYMAGFSAGGFMTIRYVCDHPERIAAAAYVSATLIDSLRSRCKSSYPMPILAINGTDDFSVPYYGGRLGLASAPQTAEFFAGINRCQSPPLRSELPNVAKDYTRVVLDSYTVCASEAPVLFYTVNGGGHAWPGTRYQSSLLRRVSYDIDATQLIGAFLSQYQR